MLPLMVAPAMVGLMYRLVLHEFVGPVPYYLYMFFGDSPVLPRCATAFWTLVRRSRRCSGRRSPSCCSTPPTGDPARTSGDAAALDGASNWQLLTLVELPLMAPTLAVAAFIRFIDGFRVFDNVYTLVGSGPGGSTASLSIYIYEAFFKQGAIGKAVAASILLFCASFAGAGGARAGSPAAGREAQA